MVTKCERAKPPLSSQHDRHFAKLPTPRLEFPLDMLKVLPRLDRRSGSARASAEVVRQ
jgi:hypothetical protein